MNEASNTNEANKMITGGCLCGSVRYEIKGALIRNVVNCYCRMCQQQHGGVGAHTKALKSDVAMRLADGLTWYESSPMAMRAFCCRCGSGLFWQAKNDDTIGIIAATLDDASDLKIIGHIYVAEKLNFLTIHDSHPQFQQSSQGQLANDYPANGES